MQTVKEMNGLKTSMWPSWAELFAEIPEFEADFRHDFELLYMMMIVKGGQDLYVVCFMCV